MIETSTDHLWSIINGLRRTETSWEDMLDPVDLELKLRIQKENYLCHTKLFYLYGRHYASHTTQDQCPIEELVHKA